MSTQTSIIVVVCYDCNRSFPPADMADCTRQVCKSCQSQAIKQYKKNAHARIPYRNPEMKVGEVRTIEGREYLAQEANPNFYGGWCEGCDLYELDEDGTDRCIALDDLLGACGADLREDGNHIIYKIKE